MKTLSKNMEEPPKPKYQGFINLDNVKIPEGADIEVLKSYKMELTVVCTELREAGRYDDESNKKKINYEFGIKTAEIIAPIDTEKKEEVKKKKFKISELV
jgi:hypothetical protein